MSGSLQRKLWTTLHVDKENEMQIVKNYLDTMFQNLPKTEKVFKAKQELYQMMEDKYTELLDAGKSENEAVGTVISEFGNLDEIADSLGIGDDVRNARGSQEYYGAAGAGNGGNGAGNYAAGNSAKKSKPKYTSKTAALIMSVYWSTITCVYLIWSFATFHWHYTWIIWPVAGVVHKILSIVFGANDEEDDEDE